MVYKSVLGEENSVFKLILPCFKIGLVSHTARGAGVEEIRKLTKKWSTFKDQNDFCASKITGPFS